MPFLNPDGVPTVFKISIVGDGVLMTYVLKDVVDIKWFDIFIKYQEQYQDQEDFMFLVSNLVDHLTGRCNIKHSYSNDTIRDFKQQLNDDDDDNVNDVNERLNPMQKDMIAIYDEYSSEECFGIWKNGLSFSDGPIVTTGLVYHIYMDERSP